MIFYLLIRCITFPFSLLSYRSIHRIGNALGTALYYLYPKFRKRALSNLALARTLHLSASQIPSLAKRSFQSLLITCLEYAKLYREKNIEEIVYCENPETADRILQEGKGVIFFCGHQANWELLFLDGTSRWKGTAIGRPIKNRYLYRWVLAIREKFGGKIVPPKEGFKGCMRALKQGHFVGIVGDQGMPDSGFSSPFFGQNAWTSPLPALLSYRSGRPVLVATIRRVGDRYAIRYSDPIWPNSSESMESEVQRIMLQSLSLLEESIRENPDQWLWVHNRWKQQLPNRLKKAFRHDSVAIVLPQNKDALQPLLPHLSIFREIYPTEPITLFAPQEHLSLLPSLAECEVKSYQSMQELLTPHYKPKLLFDFTANKKIKRHFLSLSCFGVYTQKDLKKWGAISQGSSLSDQLTQALTKRQHAL